MEAARELSAQICPEARGRVSARVAVCIVTYNSAGDLADCFASVDAQAGDLELVVIDCASSDTSVAAARRARPARIPTRIVELDENRGFAGGMNEALLHTDAPFVLTLNPDARLGSDCVRRLVSRATASERWRVGAVAARLTRPGGSTLDACGMYLTRSWRHLDRGSAEPDRGQLREPERVFGATGAASLFVREALDDVSVDGETFDSSFHSFREDAELAFRLRERGWEVLYEPEAGVVHRRRVTPERRRELPARVNYHSLKNRYLIRAYHQGAGLFWRHFVHCTARDLVSCN